MQKNCHQADTASRLGGVAAKMASRGCDWTLASRQRCGVGGIHELSDAADCIGVPSVNSRTGHSCYRSGNLLCNVSIKVSMANNRLS